MEYTLFICGILLILLLVLMLLSVLDAALFRLSRVDLIVLADESSRRQDPMFQLLADDALRVQLHLRVGTQFTIVVIAILTTYAFFKAGGRYALLESLAATGAMVLLFRQILPGLIAHSRPDRCLVQLLPVLKAFYTLTRPLVMPVLSSLRLAEKTEEVQDQEDSAEATEEEIQAYLDVGEQDGIIEEGDSEMIQSVVEFGDTLVKKVMTPRTEIVGLPLYSTVREVRDTMLEEKHSRIPIYKDQIDNIVGMVYVRHLLGHCEESKFENPISQFVLPVPFVPETKKVRELLKELQSSGANMAVVVDEFGGVSGLVTMEDLLEEIVGDIRDEDEPHEEDIRAEEGGTYRISGDTSLSRLEEIVSLEAEDEDCMTVSGLVIRRIGRVPTSGEILRLKDCQVEVLQSDGRRIIDLRVSKVSSIADTPRR